MSLVKAIPAADPEAACAHFDAKLAVETDPYDLDHDLDAGVAGIVVIDARPREAWVKCRIPGAVSLPYREIDTATTQELSRDSVLVVYCWGPACNAGAKACARLARLGFKVKELIGGIEYWREEGFTVEGTHGLTAPLYKI